MKHSTEEDLINLHDLLENIRKIEKIKEKSYGHFYYRGKGLLHFHTDSGKLYADFLDERIELGYIETPSREKKNELLLKIREYVNNDIS
ncbi:hypothetical protein ACNF40_05450 [Cuniculiplasma sp. SKW4]|uniref:hypothetical protein n=1 Tax=Cuniculiplasma sp. SKW4 TaxID=3400171 RepID=UPI003FD3F96A